MKKTRGKKGSPGKTDFLDDFCKSIEIPEISLADWEDCHQNLDLTVPLFLSSSEASGGIERTLAFSRTTTTLGRPRRAKVQCLITVPPQAKDGQTVVVPGEGDACDDRTGDLKVIIRIKSSS